MQLAHNLGCVVLGNGHFGKEKGSGARRASMGSTAFTNTPRVGLAMAYDDEDPDVRVVEVIKSNIGPKGVGRNYRLKTVDRCRARRAAAAAGRRRRRNEERRRADPCRQVGKADPRRARPGADPRRAGDRGEVTPVPGHGRRGEAGRKPRHRLPVGAHPAPQRGPDRGPQGEPRGRLVLESEAQRRGELVTAPATMEVGGSPLTPPITLSTDFSFQAVFEVPTTDFEGVYRVVCRGWHLPPRGSL